MDKTASLQFIEELEQLLKGIDSLDGSTMLPSSFIVKHNITRKVELYNLVATIVCDFNRLNVLITDIKNLLNEETKNA